MCSSLSAHISVLSITKSEMWYLSYLYKDCLETGREYRIYSEAGGGQSIVTATQICLPRCGDMYCTREEWGAVIVNYFQGSDLQLPLGKNRKREVWQEMVREAAVRLCRGRGEFRTVPQGKLFILWLWRGGGALAQNKENLI